MSGADWTALLPMIITGAAAIVAMVVIAVHRSHGLTLGVTLRGLVLASLSLWPAAAVAPRQVTPVLVVHDFALSSLGMILVAWLAVALRCHGYFAKCAGR